MQKKTIAVDVDDVLADSAVGFVNFSNERWGTTLTVDDFTEHWGEMWQVNHEEVVKRANIIHGSKIMTNFMNNEKAFPVLKKLSEKYRLIVLTSRPKDVQKETIAWLDRHYNGIFDDFVFAGLYDGVPENAHLGTKAGMAELHKIDYLIDDHPKHCLAVAELGIKSLLFGDYKWNRDFKSSKNVTKVKDWERIGLYFEGIN